MEFKNSQTVKNLMSSFVGESGVYQRYSYYAKRANKDGFKYIEDIFNETALNELYHAKRFMFLINKELPGEKIMVDQADYPVFYGTTLENLKSAALGEYEEAYEIYPTFANTAREEGFKEVATYFDLISDVEKFHHKRYDTLAQEVERGYFHREGDCDWICLKCGHHHKGPNPPKVCPICDHSEAYFKPICPSGN
ncbi:rubrerythrin family protein [Anaerofustis stercorihominis]|uniref:Rubrerythrin n=1 Tax=Anaerofustis stercorihominis DSM 17244 TaxID=445971 RepID=B1C8E3_9FIRM|nr:ferritin family protein [Anaerofustis stercorihominis]EDS73280.1 Rubrerythrin [Anaerofustis stercorihominis DSM 17244]MCQ4794571.1 rubrerythrin family protein [Anaerofustis stercorihominis]